MQGYHGQKKQRKMYEEIRIKNAIEDMKTLMMYCIMCKVGLLS